MISVLVLSALSAGEATVIAAAIGVIGAAATAYLARRQAELATRVARDGQLIDDLIGERAGLVSEIRELRLDVERLHAETIRCHAERATDRQRWELDRLSLSRRVETLESELVRRKLPLPERIVVEIDNTAGDASEA